MIHEVDKALKTVVSTAAGAPEDLQVVFEPPTRQWAEKLGGVSTIDLCLYDIREDMKQRKVGQTPMRNDRNRIIGWRPPPRIYRLSYIGTAWAHDTESDHELLGWLLQVFAGMKQLPPSSLTGSLAVWGLAAIETCQPTAEQRPTPQSLTALSGEVRPTLDIVVSAPVVFPASEAAGLVLEELVLNAQGKTGQPYERVQRRFSHGIAELERSAPGHPLVEKSRAPQVDEELPMREDDPERR